MLINFLLQAITILQILNEHGILTDLQHGLRIGRYCETQLITTFHDIVSAYNKKSSQIDIAVLDFSKEFDTLTGYMLNFLSHTGLVAWCPSLARKQFHQPGI